jgi:hypothetical protein
METLSAAIRAKQKRGDPGATIDADMVRLSARKVPEIDGYLISPVATLPSRVADVMQLGTRRMLDVADSAIREINLERANGACLLVRAVFETGCLMFYLSEQVRRAVQSPDSADLERLGAFAFNTLVGSGPKAKTFVFQEGHRVTNVLTIMEKLDKELDAPFLGYYEGLSEHSHPNAHGMLLTYGDTHRGCVTTFTDGKQSRIDASLHMCVSALAISLKLAESSYSQWESDRIALAMIAEKAIHDNGTWPSDIPFPIPRRDDGTFPTK